MREIRKYGSAGGVAGNGHPYPDKQGTGNWPLGTFPQVSRRRLLAQKPNIRIHQRDPPKIQTTAPTVR